MKFTLLVITDGRDEYCARSLTSAFENLPAPERVVLVNDWNHKLGFAGAIQQGWDLILESDAELIFHLECDFTFNERIDVSSMVRLLDDPRVAQVALKRQAWSPEEKRAGGIVELRPAAFEERNTHGIIHTVTRTCFTTNPCMYRRDVAERGWPQEAESEGKFGIRLFEESYDTVSCFLGGKFEAPKVHHIGEQRCGNGY